MRTSKKHGFTLVEILIVVVILGILAAIVIPQFSDASTEAKTSALASNLQSLRSQIELYHIKSLTADYPATLAILATEGYLREVPVNPFTGALDWTYNSSTGVVGSPSDPNA